VGYGGVNICPTAVPAPDDAIEDFDLIIDFLKSDENFEELVEYLDNQGW